VRPHAADITLATTNTTVNVADGAAPPEIVRTVFVAAPREVVFAYFTHAKRMLEWIGTSVELDPRPGGRVRIVPNSVDVIAGAFLEVTPPSRVVFTWGFEGDGQALPAGGSVVEVTLTEVPGGTEVRLVHRSLPDAVRDRHEAGWRHYLGRLASAAGGGAPGPDPFADPSIRHGEPHPRRGPRP
jgi:uncharacterized protein YndB with AHSA1/START domain